MKGLDRITVNPKICLGQPTIRGMRITVALILKLIAGGKEKNDILAAYPELEIEDINQSLKYAALLTSENLRIIPGKKVVHA